MKVGADKAGKLRTRRAGIRDAGKSNAVPSLADGPTSKLANVEITWKFKKGFCRHSRQQKKLCYDPNNCGREFRAKDSI